MMAAQANRPKPDHFHGFSIFFCLEKDAGTPTHDEGDVVALQEMLQMGQETLGGNGAEGEALGKGPEAVGGAGGENVGEKDMLGQESAGGDEGLDGEGNDEEPAAGKNPVVYCR